MSKGAREPCFTLLNKLISNIAENKNPEQDAKFRSVKKDNATLKKVVTKFSEGAKLMDAIGFTVQKVDDTEVWVHSGSVNYLKGVQLELQAGYSGCVSD